MVEVHRYSAIPIQVHLDIAHGDSPVWLFGPAPYSILRLSPDLERTMQAWEADFYRAWREGAVTTLTATADWRERVRTIASTLATELGNDFVVVCRNGDEFRSELAATNAVVSKSLRDRAIDIDAEADEVRKIIEKNPNAKFGWTAVRPE